MIVWILPVALQGVAMVVDEVVCHRRRGLPRWERIGHPLDTLTLVACLGWLAVVSRDTSSALPIYIGLAIFSTLFVTKDEAVHARECGPGEHWLHAILFSLHPIVLAAFAILWWTGHHTMISIQLAVVTAFLGYQVVYWNVLRAGTRIDGRALRPAGSTAEWRRGCIDNRWYADLGDRWYEARDTPIALLRAEARHRNPWLAEQLGPGPKRILDIGCGGGFLANDLAARGHRVAGLDMTPENLAIARARDVTRSVAYYRGDAYALPFADGSFDAVCAMDLLEHVEEPARVIGEAARVLAPNGTFFFHTFNRTWLAHLIVIKGVELFVRNTPRDLHVLRLFLTPAEVTSMCRTHGLETVALEGSRPRFRWPLWRMVLTGEVGDDFAFTFTRSTQLGYTGYARKGGRC